jgi:hypothetical protein
MRERKTADPLKDDFAVLAAICFVVFVNLCAWSMLADGDTGWHVAAGEWILDHRAVPRVDPFSYTFAGKPWVAHEWLAELVMAAAWRAGGWSALSLLFAVAGTALFLTVGLWMRRWLSSLPLFLGLMCLFILLQPFLLARPHLLAWPILAGWMIGLVRARELGRAPHPALALLMLVWANLHGSFLFGLLLIGPFALEALIEAREAPAPVILRWGGFGLLALLASFATPHGPAGLLFPLGVSSMASLPLIREWQPTDIADLSGFSILLFAGLFLALWRGVRIPPLRLILLLGLLALALLHIRHQAILAIVAAILLPPALIAAPSRPPLDAILGANRRGVAALLIILVAIAAARLAIPMTRPDGQDAPLTAIAAVPPELRTRPVFNHYGFGGGLILAGMRPYIDGRADLYGDDFMLDYSRISHGDAALWRAAVARWRIDWAILRPQEPLAFQLAQDRGWSLLYKDRWAVIYARRPQVRQAARR